jgi:hypothetical protein
MAEIKGLRYEIIIGKNGLDGKPRKTTWYANNSHLSKFSYNIIFN